MATKNLPPGFVKCESTDCLYRLKPRKKKRTEENLEPNAGKEIYIHSHYAKNYVKHTIEENDPWLDKIKQFVRMGITYHKP